MAEHAEKAKGKIKEEIGHAIGDRGLERQGKRDQRRADVKKKAVEVVDSAKEKAREVTDSAKGKVDDLRNRNGR
jgi:uncharacterized protein YjbJ (UPF0337 family)